MKKTVTGKLHLNRRGFGFVTQDDGGEDIFIPKQATTGAITGDRVVVALEKATEKGLEGRIEEILERKWKYLVGIVIESDHPQRALAYVTMLGPKRLVKVKSKEKETFNVGDRLYLEVLDWGDEEEPVRTQLAKHLGNISNASKDIEIALLEADITREFPADVMQEAEAIGTEVTESDCEGREDFTGLECFTIDPDTARDFDDALALSKDAKGHYHLSVHIADVSHYVKPNTPLDREAVRRSNSTYFPGTCIPMLPKSLSNGLCSLNEGVIRLVASIFIELSPDGEVVNYRIARGYIKSRKRFTYKEALSIIEGKQSSPYKEALDLMVELCKILKKKRFERGCVDLAMPEMILKIDANGVPHDYEISEYDITHQLVEEYMLKANEIVATHLSKEGKGAIFRVHEEPSTENMKEFFALVRSLGFHVPGTPTQADVQKLMEEIKETPFSNQISIAFIKSMKQAVYSHQNVGHYGLSLEYYCHFTSPIRRYSDLIAHRLLFGDEVPEDLERLATSCSEKERISMQAEMNLMHLKKLRFLKKEYNEEPDITYDAIISRIKPFGISFELTPLTVEGFIHVSELDDDYFEYDAKAATLRGRRTKKVLKAGDRIEVFVDYVDLIYRDTEWTLYSS